LEQRVFGFGGFDLVDEFEVFVVELLEFVQLFLHLRDLLVFEVGLGVGVAGRVSHRWQLGLIVILTDFIVGTGEDCSA
jgi:hypothetical protein